MRWYSAIAISAEHQQQPSTPTHEAALLDGLAGYAKRHQDTGGMRYSSADPAALERIAWLVKLGSAYMPIQLRLQSDWRGSPVPTPQRGSAAFGIVQQRHGSCCNRHRARQRPHPYQLRVAHVSDARFAARMCILIQERSSCPLEYAITRPAQASGCKLILSARESGSPPTTTSEA